MLNFFTIFFLSNLHLSDLIKHSLSIISVFKFTWLARSIIFLLIYCYFISNFISIITIIPVVVIVVMNAMIFTLSARENLNEYKNSLTNIEHEASTCRISEDQLFYLQSRGIGFEEAVSMMVSGFCRDVFNQLPMEFAAEADKLLALKLEGSVG